MGGTATFELLEREDAFRALDDARATARRGEGRLVLVSGDAGIGKSALVREFCARASGARVLLGSCDGLQTPRPLGPFLDIAAATGGRLAETCAADATAQSVFEALVEELRGGLEPIVVIEDMHWTDEASLDIIGLLGRRVEQLGVLVIVTYRSDELPRTHPLRLMLGDFATVPGVVRLYLDPLSPDAVAKLCAADGVDAETLYAKTAGNPFFVTEVLASGEVELPMTIRDATLARAARLSAPARDLLDAVAIVPPRTELWLLEAIAGASLAALDECLASGMLRAEEHAVAFRHELARIAVEESINPVRQSTRHREALRALCSPPAGSRDLARLAHHADAAQDGDAVLEFAPPAGDHAAAVGAHREAAAQYARALRYAGDSPPEVRTDLLERRSFECHLTSQHDEAITSLEAAIDEYRALGDARKEGLALVSLAARRWCAGDTAAAEDDAFAAITVLEELGPSPELTRAYAGACSMAMNSERSDLAFTWGRRALELIDPEREPETFIYQLNNMGTMKLLLDRPEGRVELERSIALSAEAGLHSEVGRGYIHIGWTASRIRDFALIERLEDGIDYCTKHGLELWRLYLIAHRARADLDQGRWTEAADGASFVLQQPAGQPLLGILGLTVLGTVRARRGDPDSWSLLDEARDLAIGQRDLQLVAPVAIARTEAASLEGRADAAADASDAVLALALDRDAAWISGELALWRRLAGIEEPCPDGVAAPFALHLSGDWARAAELWTQRRCPYEAALALGDADDGDAMRRAVDELRALGAGPAAASVVRRLRERGERGVTRGPRPSTRGNPAGLTPREVEVVALLAEGLRNSEIAARLFVSQRTVDHHVSTILRKLDVKTRVMAGNEAVRLGLTGANP